MLFWNSYDPGARGHVKSSHFPWFQDITNDIFSRIQWLESWSIEHVIPRRNIPSEALAQCVTYENRHHSYIAVAGPVWLQSMLAQESRNAWCKSAVVLINVFLYRRVHPFSSHVLFFDWFSDSVGNSLLFFLELLKVLKKQMLLENTGGEYFRILSNCHSLKMWFRQLFSHNINQNCNYSIGN